MAVAAAAAATLPRRWTPGTARASADVLFGLVVSVVRCSVADVPTEGGPTICP